LLYDEENNMYVGQREDQQREVASLTKIMTTLVALELMKRYHLDKELLVRVSKNCALNGTSAKLPEGGYVKLNDLLYGTMLPSGNDAAYLLAEVLGLLLFYENIKP
jgi:D-alanyl-D-alanine carboxypeptidase (penicillin-binding protein 5/6)